RAVDQIHVGDALAVEEDGVRHHLVISAGMVAHLFLRGREGAEGDVVVADDHAIDGRCHSLPPGEPPASAAPATIASARAAMAATVGRAKKSTAGKHTLKASEILAIIWVAISEWP